MTGRQLWPIALLLALTATPGCQPLATETVVSDNSPAPPPIAQNTPAPSPETSSFAPGDLQAGEIPATIAGLELLSKNPLASAAEKTEALRRLALLHLAPHNPARNLGLAEAAQSAYLQLQPLGTVHQEGQIWLVLIRETLADEQFRQQQSKKILDKDKDISDLSGEKQRLAQKVSALESANAKLKADIEKLKFIDLSVEKKRKSFR